MKLKEFNFNIIKLERPLGPVTLEVRVVKNSADEKPIAKYMGESIGDTLRSLPGDIAEAEILEKRWFFDIYVMTVKEPVKNEN